MLGMSVGFESQIQLRVQCGVGPWGKWIHKDYSNGDKNFFTKDSICNPERAIDMPDVYAFCLDKLFDKDERKLNEFLDYAYPIAKALDNLFEVTKNKEEFKDLFKQN